MLYAYQALAWQSTITTCTAKRTPLRPLEVCVVLYKPLRQDPLVRPHAPVLQLGTRNKSALYDTAFDSSTAHHDMSVWSAAPSRSIQPTLLSLRLLC